MPRKPYTYTLSDQNKSEVETVLLEYGSLHPPKSDKDIERLLNAIKLSSDEMFETNTQYATRVAELESEKQEDIDSWKDRIKGLRNIIRVYATEHRDELTHNGKRKLIRFAQHGSIRWVKGRSRLEAVSSWRNVLSRVKRFFSKQQQRRFIRIQEEVNKQALLQADEPTREKAGVRISEGKEHLSISPSRLNKKTSKEIQELLNDGVE